MVDVPAVVRNKACAAGAEWWIEALPELIATLEQEWSINVGRPYADATEAFVAEATLDSGAPAVLKLVVPRDGGAARNEAIALRLASGVGCVQLLREDVDRGALLLERLGRSLHDLGLAIGRRHEILCDTAARLWRPAPDCGLPTGHDKGQWLIEYVVTTWEELNRPCTERAVDDAIACARRRVAAHDNERAVLVHGDVHQATWTRRVGDLGMGCHRTRVDRVVVYKDRTRARRPRHAQCC